MKFRGLRQLINLCKMAFQRVTVVAISLLAQLILFALMIWKFRSSSQWFYIAMVVLSLVVTLFIISKNTNPVYKLAWLVPILSFPVFGGLFYLMLGGNRISKRNRKRLNDVEKNFRAHTPQNPEIMDALRETSEDGAIQAAYLQKVAGCPVYRNTRATYYPLGDDAFPAMLDALRSAEKYIFLEYFIINPGIMWDSILEILKEKAAAGLDVRVLYDDFGSITQLPLGYRRELEGYGIKCQVFMPFIPIVTPRLNNRDHRKQMIIDGRIGFTGGINLADEYINRKERFGHWKDNAIALHGDAVWTMTVTFLALWDYITETGDTISNYLPPEPDFSGSGFVQPYIDSPMDDEAVGETVYLNLISRAHQAIYIMTPYLIIDYSMTEALCNAAKSGLDVRIITPHIPDKWYAHALTRAHYEQLIRSGVHIHEYTPGFIHSKVFWVDGEFATVGTINMDYRSLYLHFENGVFLSGSGCLRDIREDFDRTFACSEEISLRQCTDVKAPMRLLRALLRLIAPLM